MDDFYYPCLLTSDQLEETRKMVKAGIFDKKSLEYKVDRLAYEVLLLQQILSHKLTQHKDILTPEDLASMKLPHYEPFQI